MPGSGRWRGRYDRLHLHTSRVQSALPGMQRLERVDGDLTRYGLPAASGGVVAQAGSPA